MIIEEPEALVAKILEHRLEADRIERELKAGVVRVYELYREQKAIVSNGRAVSWYCMRIKKFSVGRKWIRLSLEGTGRFGYVFNTSLRLPVPWMCFSDEDVRVFVNRRIREEAADLDRRQKAAKEKKQNATRVDDLETLHRLMHQYPEAVTNALLPNRTR